MEEDGNGSADPAPFRIEGHRDRIAQQHAGKVERTKQQQSAAEPSSGSDQKAMAARETQTDFDVNNNNDNLNREEITVRQQS